MIYNFLWIEIKLRTFPFLDFSLRTNIPLGNVTVAQNQLESFTFSLLLNERKICNLNALCSLSQAGLKQIFSFKRVPQWKDVTDRKRRSATLLLVRFPRSHSFCWLVMFVLLRINWFNFSHTLNNIALDIKFITDIDAYFGSNSVPMIQV